MTNPAQAIRLLVTYVVIIPLAALVGWLLCDPLDYGTMGFFAFLAVLIASPIFIKWHYPILLFGLGCPAVCFFLPGKPPLWEAVVMLSLGLSVIERTLNSDRRFISAPVFVWPLMFTLGMVYLTAYLTGGIGLHSLGGSTGGGKKYLDVFLGIATFFALTSRKIPKEKRGLYIALICLAASPGFISDLFPLLPAPLNYVNLLFPPSGVAMDQVDQTQGIASVRFTALASSAGVVYLFMLVKYGLRGVLMGPTWRQLLFVFSVVVSLLGGFRIVFIGMGMMFTLLFFLEGLHRSRLLPVVLLGLFVGAAMIFPFADKLPVTLQRSISFLPLKLDPQVQIDADGSKAWREAMWRDVWPKVPQYLLLGKGYSLQADDFNYMGGGTFVNSGENLDASGQGLAVSMDYHNGPLSTLMPFGIWGMISYLWLTAASLYILICNYRYGDEEIKTFNRFWLVMTIIGLFSYFFMFGAYCDNVGGIAKLTGFSVAFNWGVCRPKKPAVVPTPIRRLPRPAVAAPV
ncbi:MAG TPA: O-antigen ligase family protein [Candidatus Sulfotelmatobacter sp.]|nr:O-antigen ligase family protein [Candidatus Sulfotelmatobacter sp.]